MLQRVPLVCAAIAAIFAAGCSRHPGVCSNPDALGTLKSLVFGKQASDSDTGPIDRVLQISDFDETGFDGAVHRCTARFEVPKEALAAEAEMSGKKMDDKRIAQMARGFGMSEKEISSGVNSGTLEYDLAQGEGENGAAQYSVTLKTYSIARARLLQAYLSAVDIASSAESLKPPAEISWGAMADGDPKLYKVGNLDLMLSSGQTFSGDAAPRLRISGGGVRPIEDIGEAGGENVGARLLVGKVDPKQPGNQIFFVTFSGGAHCCTQITIFDRAGGAWKKLDLGTWDGEPMDALPKDIDGDRVPDIVLSDNRFLYTFASYAGSWSPPRIFNVVGGAVAEVTKQKRYFPFLRDYMTKEQAGCLLHSNAACAAFVASASILGFHDWAWQFMLDHYDATDQWQMPKVCDIAAKYGECPSEHETVPDGFPSALAGFLKQTGYFDPSTASASRAVKVPPSFDCGKVHSRVLRLVCATPELSAADRNLAAAFYAAISNSKTPDDIRADERAWIVQRNTSAGDVEVLGALYRGRIAALALLACQEIAADSNSGRICSTQAPAPAEQNYYYVTGLDPTGDNWLALRSEPSSYAGYRIEQLAPDELLTLLEVKDVWSHVQLKSGQTGWVFSKYIACCRSGAQ